MSRHEGVSCDACLRSNFRGRRYKCLVCYDYDLCATCHEAGATTTRHTAEHPMQCILTRTDAELFYGGEAVPADQPQSLVCPHCGRLGLTEHALIEHVTAEHAHTAAQVVCPVCAAVPLGEPNHVTEHLAAHLSAEHRGGGGGRARLPVAFDEEPLSAARPAGRRPPHPSRPGAGTRTRRFNNMHFRESMDPITELLSQLSGARRTPASASSGASSSASSSSAASQLQQLQMHLQLERQQYAQVVRQHSERTPRRQTASAAATPAAPDAAGAADPPAAGAEHTAEPAAAAPAGPQFLLSGLREEEELAVDAAQRLSDRIDRSLFAQEVVLSTLSRELAECDVQGGPAPGAGVGRPAPASRGARSQV
ncbi:E3 ubiquitin-protein ligase KCMF1-like [Amphibalanus amphitrite]|uniref:E3 ubiquitin-protein ligase KCMF1-like n=1 Tax=Amphibalanus amphitrite TaxID=1232801 RepID=UPI001C90DB98|nr:E3 ubiquitin-protein ligase KCMF1-like [Amphibalanus amphitrite]